MVNYSIIVNGTPGEFFGISKGLRQGDPLSLYLFIIIVDFLHRNMQQLVDNHKVKGIKPTSTLPPFIIRLFVDDTFFFGQSLIVEAKEWKYVLDQYVVALGQKINL